MGEQRIVCSANEQALAGRPLQQIHSCGPRLQVIPPAGNDMAHAAAWVGHVAIESGDQVHVQMGNCLAGSLSQH